MKRQYNQIPQVSFPTAELYAQLQECTDLFDAVPTAHDQTSIEGTRYAHVAGSMLIKARSLLTEAAFDKTAHTNCTAALEALRHYFQYMQNVPAARSEYEPCEASGNCNYLV